MSLQTSKVPKSYWKSMENRKNFLDEIAKKLNINTPSDWGNVTTQNLFVLGGTTLLNRYYNGSLFTCLQSVYKDINWKREWFGNLPQHPKTYWKSMENRKNFLGEIAKKLDIKTPSDWGKVTVQDFRKLEGSTLLKYYNSSLFTCLQSVYKDIKWKREWFWNLPQLSNPYWDSMENRKNFLDEIAKKLNIKTPSDWGNVTWRKFCKLGGNPLLYKYYNNSIFTCLQSVYKDINWKREWFYNLPHVPNSYWKSIENRKNFLDETAKKLDIKTPSDWGNVTIQQIHELGGSALLNSYYNGSLFACLQSVYKGYLFTIHCHIQDTNWKREWFRISNKRFPYNHFQSFKNQLTFFDNLSQQYNLQDPSDWRMISLNLIKKRGGGPLLARYNNSISNALNAIYPSMNLLLKQTSSHSQQKTTNTVQKLNNKLLGSLQSTICV